MKDYKWGLLFVFIIFVGFITFISMYVNNDEQYNICKELNYYTTIQVKVIYYDNAIFDECKIVENGIEYSMREFYNLHKFDGMEIR